MSKEISPWSKFDLVGDIIKRVTEDLHAAVTNVKQRIDALPDNEERASEQAYAEYEVIEGLIGTTFVLYQTYLTSIVSVVKELAKDGYAGAPTNKKTS